MELIVKNVQSYPRPFALEPVAQRVRVMLGEKVLADTTAAVRTLETHHAPSYYLPRLEAAAGSYPNPSARFAALKDHLAIYAGQMAACFVGAVQVVPQPGGMVAGCLGVLPLGQAIGACVQARNCCTGPAAPSNDTVTAEVWVKAVAVVLNSSPSSTLPNPVSLTVRVAPSVWWRWVEMMLLRGPSKRMEKAGAMGHSFGLVTAMA
ncbi:MAG: DUF427 domain-containing protein [Tateyamaria sp.]|uniref:DUF427 domain-containing protein n=1 Tax=Tateyamaria sp. TaxID=1929288 RepID=UPI00329E2210